MRRGHGFWAAAAAAGVAAVALLLSASATAQPLSRTNARVACAGASMIGKMVCYHSQLRRQYGLSPLRRSAELDRSARLKAGWILRCHQFAHQPCGESFMRTFRMAGYLPWQGGWIIGENLAYGFETPWD